jgi:hypothetical protein
MDSWVPYKLILVLLLCSVGSQPLRADDRWLFVPVLTGKLPRDVSITQLSSPFEIELRSQAQTVLANSDGAVLFESRHSSEPVQLNSDEMSRLLRSVGQAARHLALGELPQAQQAMESVYALSGPARDYLNREAARARKIFDTCLMTGYLWERDQKHPQALRQMLECSRNFPGFRPEGRAYPPELREVFEQAKHQMQQDAPTMLLVQSRQTSGCGVRLNGIEAGKSPMSFSDVRAGILRVQLECQSGVAGRIHSVELKPGENRLEIDAAFESVLRSQGGLWLQYDSDGARAARADGDLKQIQRALSAGHVVALFVDGTTNPRVRVRTVADQPREIATLPHSAGDGYSLEAVAAAVKQLRVQGKQRKPALSDEQAPIALHHPPEPIPAEPAEPAPPEVPSQQNVLVGVLLAAAGAGGIATSWVLYGMRYNYRRASAEEPGLTLQPVSDDVSVAAYQTPPHWGVLASAGAGALLLGLSDYFWLPDDQGIPTLAWVAGAMGAAVAVTGVVISAAMRSCPEQPTADFACYQFYGDRAFGPLIALHSLPLLGVPISYAIRMAVRPSPEAPVSDVAFDIGPSPSGGVAFQLRGVF